MPLTPALSLWERAVIHLLRFRLLEQIIPHAQH